MTISDPGIHGAAHRWIRRHGDDATAKAREMVEAMRRKGANDGADTWIIAAIGELRVANGLERLSGSGARAAR
jgi:hypothetical protein